jgi:hypothetical protein
MLKGDGAQRVEQQVSSLARFVDGVYLMITSEAGRSFIGCVLYAELIACRHQHTVGNTL